MHRIPTFLDVQEAVSRLEGHAVKTPLLRSDAIDERVGKKVWFKAECLQKKNAFKYRGAFNRLSVLSQEERACGVVAYSSGNHAQGVSSAAKELGIDAIIVMPTDAPRVKVAGVLADDATIVTYDRNTESREQIGADIAKRDGRTLVPSYDDPYIIAGQGTIGVELSPTPGELTWPINSKSLKDVFTVSDDECLNAIRAAMAAVLGGNLPETIDTVAVILSGGNVDPEILQRALTLS